MKELCNFFKSVLWRVYEQLNDAIRNCGGMSTRRHDRGDRTDCVPVDLLGLFRKSNGKSVRRMKGRGLFDNATCVADYNAACKVSELGKRDLHCVEDSSSSKVG